jgi:lipoprotein-anchoring transpeptidase ErfK/SrfK
MRRAFVSALVLSALSVPVGCGAAWAGPLQINPDAYAAPPPPDQNGAAEPQPQPQQRSAQTQSTLGGGFIEFLFGGAAREPMIQRPFQPLPESYSRGYQPGQPDDQAQQAALTQLSSNDPATFVPSSQGDMAHPAVDPKYDRQLVDYRSEEKPGTVVIDTPHHFLFLVQDNGKAMRYGIGVGRPGFTWEGVKTISAKKEWPDWRPPARKIRSARAPCISARRSIASTAPTSPGPSVATYRRAASVCAMPTSSTSITVSRSAPKSW